MNRWMLLPAAALLCACGTNADAPADRETSAAGSPRAVALDSLFEIVRTDTLRPTADDPVANATDAVIWRDRLLLVDEMAGTLRLFRRSGEPIGTIGRAGDGPGEFRGPVYAAALDDGRLAVIELSGRLTVFSADGRYEDRWQTPIQLPASLEALPGGQIALPAMMPPRGQNDFDRLAVLIFDAAGRRIRTIEAAPRAMSGMEGSYSTPVADFLGGHFVLARSSRNTVVGISLEGDETWTSTADARYVAPDWSVPERHHIASPEVDAWYTGTQWLVRLTAVDPEHYVVSFRMPDPEGERHRFVLMNRTVGEVAQTDTVIGRLFSVGNGHVLAVREVEDDGIVVVEMRLRHRRR